MLLNFILLLSATASNLLVNGSFEIGTGVAAPPFAGIRCKADGICIGGLGTTGGIQGWAIQGEIDYIGSYWMAQEGVRSIDLAGQFAGGVSQTIATTPGVTYAVSFYLSGNPDGGLPIKSLIVEAAGQAGNFTFDTTGITHGNMGWQPRSWTFKALDSSTTLVLRTADIGGYGPVVDNVSVASEAPLSEQVIPAAALAIERQVVFGELPIPWVIRTNRMASLRAPILVFLGGRLLSPGEYTSSYRSEMHRWDIQINGGVRAAIAAALGVEVVLVYEAYVYDVYRADSLIWGFKSSAFEQMPPPPEPD